MSATAPRFFGEQEVTVGKPGGKTPLDPLVADRLLDLLSTDDEFRRLFAEDPLAALLEAGYDLPEPKGGDAVQFLPWLSCTMTGELASKQEIAESRELIREFVTGASALTVIFAFESGKISTTLTRKNSVAP